MPRHATISDLDTLVFMAREEHCQSNRSDEPFDALCVQHTFGEFITGMAKTVFISNGGFIMGVVQPKLFNRTLSAYEVAWFSNDGSGMELLDAFSKWAKSMRAKELIVHNYAGIIDQERFKRVMRRKGLKPIGCAYSKQLGV